MSEIKVACVKLVLQMRVSLTVPRCSDVQESAVVKRHPIQAAVTPVVEDGLARPPRSCRDSGRESSDRHCLLLDHGSQSVSNRQSATELQCHHDPEAR